MFAQRVAKSVMAVSVAASMATAYVPLTAFAAAAAPADQGRLKAAVLPLNVDGEMSEADREMLSQELVEGLRRGDFEVVSPGDVLASDASASTCTEAKCLKSISGATGSTHIVRANVKVVERDYEIDVELYDGRTGESIARSDEGCEICGIADVGGLMDAAAATLRTKLDALARGPSTVEIRSEPDGAQVMIDGEVVGTTPLERQVIPGKRIVRITKEGFISVEREVTFVEGVAESLSFELEKVPSRLPPRPWGWVSLSVGVASIGAATAFGLLRDQPYRLGGACQGGGVDPEGNCERLWNTEWHVFGFALAGGALTTLGIAILVNSRRDRAERKARRKAKKDRKASARLRVGPTSLGVAGRF